MNHEEARKQIKKIRGMAANKTYNTYVRNLVFDITPVLSFILDELEKKEEKKPELIWEEEFSLLSRGPYKIVNGKVVIR